jgi:2-polyprenyl-3-methyl-5-hydroxy-6-metoxy-1,4-benzoquinol methylase
MSRQPSGLQRTADHWSAQGAWETGRGLYWLELPAIQRRLNRKVSGQPDTDWIRYTLQRHFAQSLPLDRCLSLGCGQGGLERQLAALGVFRECDAIDVAQGAIAKAQALAQQSGYDRIYYAVQDANTMELSADCYDAVWSSGAVHHFERLEHVFGQVAAALKPQGLFVLNEYVGPNRFQFPARQRQAIQACHELLPIEYRRQTATALAQPLSPQPKRDWWWVCRRTLDKLRDGDLAGAIWRRLRRSWAIRTGAQPIKRVPFMPTARSVRATDPSEAVRSADIVPLLRRYFEVIEHKPLGGSILQFLLAGIAGNFQNAAGEQLLGMLFSIEDALMASGDLPSDFAYIVAAPLSANESSLEPVGGSSSLVWG